MFKGQVLLSTLPLLPLNWQDVDSLSVVFELDCTQCFGEDIRLLLACPYFLHIDLPLIHCIPNPKILDLDVPRFALMSWIFCNDSGSGIIAV